MNCPYSNLNRIMFYQRVNDRIELRLLQVSDAEELFALTNTNRDYLRTWLGWLDRTISVADTKSFIEYTLETSANNRGLTAVICDEGSIVGLIGYNHIDRQNRIGYIGYWLAANYQGKGIMTTSCQAICDYGFTTLNLNRLVINCATENQSSRAIPERLGFIHEGTMRDAEWLYDRFVNHEIYALLDRDCQNKL
jgi:ribosomal-protein-serine acetyltransferase